MTDLQNSRANQLAEDALGAIDWDGLHKRSQAAFAKVHDPIAMHPPYDPTGYPRAAWAGAKAAGNAMVVEPGYELGGALQNIAEGQGGFGDYLNAATGVAGAVPAGAAVKGAALILPMAARGLKAVEVGASLKGIRAFHGSPHDFDRFDISKIGTGEGAQAYGHGLYFAENEAVAQSYRDVLRDAKRGRMYEVNIKANPEQFLDWDKPLAQQPELFDRLKQSGIIGDKSPPHQKTGQATPQAVVQMPEAGIMDRIREAGVPGIKYLDQESRVGVAPSQPGHALASGYLNNFNGNRQRALVYAEDALLNAKQSGHALDEKRIQNIENAIAALKTEPRGTYNYVVNNDSIVDILRKYGIVGGVLGAGAIAATNNEAKAQ